MVEPMYQLLGSLRVSGVSSHSLSDDPVSKQFAPSTNLDFSGFSVLESSPTRGTGKMSSILRTCQALQDKVATLRRGNLTPSLSISGRPSLSPLQSEIRQARELIAQNRVNSRTRVLQLRRRLSWSPPATRSRGPVDSLPHVQPTVLEWNKGDDR